MATYRVLCNSAQIIPAVGDDPEMIVLRRSDHDFGDQEVARLPRTEFDRLGSELPCTVVIRPGDHT